MASKRVHVTQPDVEREGEEGGRGRKEGGRGRRQVGGDRDENR